MPDDGPNSARRQKAREAFPSSNAERMQTPVLMDICDLHALSVCPQRTLWHIAPLSCASATCALARKASSNFWYGKAAPHPASGV